VQALIIAMTAFPAVSFAEPEEAAAALAAQVQTGTLLLSEGDCLAVKAFTGSPYTHVAAVVEEQGHAFVYDSQNGVGVRKLALDDYLAATRPDELHVLHPASEFDEGQVKAFHASLEQQVGRPYSIAHHLTGSRCDGLHCAEYVTDALVAAEIVKAQKPPRVSPASLRQGLLRHRLYDEAESLTIAASEQQREEGGNWCEELWLDTKDCCAGCWGGFRRRVLCR